MTPYPILFGYQRPDAMVQSLQQRATGTTRHRIGTAIEDESEVAHEPVATKHVESNDKENRRAAILSFLDESGCACVEEIVKAIKVSESTIRLDLEALHQARRVIHQTVSRTKFWSVSP